MMLEKIRKHWLEYSLLSVWVINCMLASIIAIREVWIPYMDAGGDNYTKIQSDPFDGTVMPISYIPDWTKPANQDKSKRFEDIPISEYLPMPTYDPTALLSDLQNTKKMSIILHYTYTVPYMGSYRLNYKENDGSHLGIDIRAPIGTPVLSLANGVVIRTVEADATGNKFVVIRHDGVPMNGKTTSLYSGYLHLSQITVTEGTKVKKGDMIGRVGITGITTTPHLHLQLDTADAPFHPYWPFTSTDSKNAGLSLFESINNGLGKENAMRYTINPLTFVNAYLGGMNNNPPPILTSAPIKQSANTTMVSESIAGDDIAMREREMLLGSYTSPSIESCQKKRFDDIDEKSPFGQGLYKLIDTKCLFQKDGNYTPNESITLREVVINTMKYFDVEKASGTSPYLDLSINDPLQGYAIVLYRRGIISGNYFSPDKLLSKSEATNLIVKIGNIPNNPGQIRIYNDVDQMNLHFGSIQAYGYAVRARAGRFFPDSVLTRSVFAQLLINLDKRK